MTLQRYRAKRDFRRTSEPRGATSPRSDAGGRFLFVVQKHAARRLHYDFRLEIGGVLKSWAVPKQFPVVLGEKRLAMQVEDHPREYASFEGIIPAGNYGAGTVMLWDAGIAEVLETAPEAALKKGRLALELAGQKLKGHWTLVRLRANEENDSSRPWLIIKTGEATKPVTPRQDDKSVQSGRTMKQIAADGDAIWESNRKSSRRASAGRRGAAGVRTRRSR